MKKQVVMLAVAALFSGNVWAAPETVLEKQMHWKIQYMVQLKLGP